MRKNFDSVGRDETRAGDLEEKLFNIVKGEEDEIEAIVALGEQGVDVNCVDDDGWTPLMYAATTSKPMAICAMREFGLDFEDFNFQGDTALMMVLSNKDFDLSKRYDREVADILLDNRDRDKEFDMCGYVVRHGNSDMLRLLDDRGLVAGRDIMFDVVKYGDKNMMDVVLSAGIAKMYDRNEEGLMPVQYAIVHEKNWAVKALLLRENRFLVDDEDRELRDYDIVDFALKRDVTKFLDTFLESKVSFFARKDRGKPFMDRILTDVIGRGFSAENQAMMNNIFKKGMNEIAKSDRPIGKWKILSPYFSKEEVQDALDEEMVKKLEHSFIDQKVLETIKQKHKQRGGAELSDSQASDDTVLDEEVDFGEKRECPGSSPAPGNALKRTKTIGKVGGASMRGGM